MAKNPYAAYQKKQEKLSPGQLLANFFEKAAQHMANAEQAILANDPQKRFEESQRASDILADLGKSLTPTTPEEVATAESLIEYYSTMTVLIARMNSKNDIETCKAVKESFKSMQGFWKNMA